MKQVVVKILYCSLFVLESCFLNTASPEGHSYKLINADVKTLTNNKLFVVCTQGKKRYHFSSNEIILDPNNVEICSNAIRSKKKECLKMVRDTIFSDQTFKTSLRISDMKFHKYNKEDTIRVLYDSENGRKELLFVNN